MNGDSTLRIALGSDERSHVTDFVEQELRSRGFDVQLFGPLRDESAPSAWPVVAAEAAQAVSSGNVEEAVLFCWTGTGVSIAANKVPGIRAALCGDAETARGAKAWNQANVLCLSLRTTTEARAREILDAWFSTAADPGEDANVQAVNEMDEGLRGAPSAERAG
ncbi:MAG TPA: RpiB/LacA/LacB family sugar-phosphate isomerase [Dehalococcoidia bacterium]